MVMAGDKNRDADENQGRDQTPEPHSTLPREPSLDSIKAPVDFVTLIPSGAWFFRHKLRPPVLKVPAAPFQKSLLFITVLVGFG
jgi:hypothetical protein